MALCTPFQKLYSDSANKETETLRFPVNTTKIQDKQSAIFLFAAQGSIGLGSQKGINFDQSAH